AADNLSGAFPQRSGSSSSAAPGPANADKQSPAFKTTTINDAALTALTVPTLRQIATSLGINLSQCIEKEELISAIKRRVGHGSEPSGSAMAENGGDSTAAKQDSSRATASSRTPATPKAHPTTPSHDKGSTSQADAVAELLSSPGGKCLEECIDLARRKTALEAWLEINRASDPLFNAIQDEIRHLQVLFHGVERSLAGARSRIQRTQMQATINARLVQGKAAAANKDPCLQDLAQSIGRRGATVANAVGSFAAIVKVVDSLSKSLAALARDVKVVQMDSEAPEKKVKAACEKCLKEQVVLAEKVASRISSDGSSNGNKVPIEKVLAAVRKAYEVSSGVMQPQGNSPSSSSNQPPAGSPDGPRVNSTFPDTGKGGVSCTRVPAAGVPPVGASRSAPPAAEGTTNTGVGAEGVDKTAAEKPGSAAMSGDAARSEERRGGGEPRSAAAAAVEGRPAAARGDASRRDAYGEGPADRSVESKEERLGTPLKGTSAFPVGSGGRAVPKEPKGASVMANNKITVGTAEPKEPKGASVMANNKAIGTADPKESKGASVMANNKTVGTAEPKEPKGASVMANNKTVGTAEPKDPKGASVMASNKTIGTADPKESKGASVMANNKTVRTAEPKEPKGAPVMANNKAIGTADPKESKGASVMANNKTVGMAEPKEPKGASVMDNNKTVGMAEPKESKGGPEGRANNEVARTRERRSLLQGKRESTAGSEEKAAKISKHSGRLSGSIDGEGCTGPENRTSNCPRGTNPGTVDGIPKKKKRKQRQSSELVKSRDSVSSDQSSMQRPRKRMRTGDLGTEDGREEASAKSVSSSSSLSSAPPTMQVRIPDCWKTGQKVQFPLPDGIVQFFPPDQCRPGQVLLYNKVTGTMTYTPPEDEIEVISLSD
ncbi:hypothetical protein FOL46_007673, partial [Perkinsus olseni]